VWGVEMPCNAE